MATERAQSVIVFGPTQSHKTSGFAVPALLEWSGPVVAASVKTDLIDHTIDHRRSCGEVQCFDPSGSTGMASATWTPLAAARTWPAARRAAAALTEVAKSSVGTMTDGDFWYATASRMLAPLLFAAAVGRRDMGDVVRWVDTQEEAEVLELLAAAGVPEAVHAARSAFGKEERQRSSIYTTVETILEPFAATARPPGAAPWRATEAWSAGAADGTGDGAADGAAGQPVVDPVRLVSGNNTLYLCAPAHDQRRLTPLFVSVVRQIIEHVYDQVTLTHRPLDPPLLVVLDALTPAERLAFVLHDMFDLPFDEIAPMVDRSPAAARQLASRARRRVRCTTRSIANPLSIAAQVPGSGIASNSSTTSLPAPSATVSLAFVP